MDGQDQKTATAISAATEGHEAHKCHRCGWPFPNPHPSAKHRRSHRKVCGTIEGYKIVQSEDGRDAHLVVNVDEQASDDDLDSPSPKIAKENSLEADDGSGEKANKSEEDVFSDAPTGFSDSQRSEESFEVVTEQEKKAALKGKDDENAEKTELNGLKNSSQICDTGVINADGHFSEHVVHLTGDVGPVNPPILVGLRDPAEPGNLIKDSANNSIKNADVDVKETVNNAMESLAAGDELDHRAPSPLDSHETCLKNDGKIIENGEQPPQSSGTLSPGKEEQKVEYTEDPPAKSVSDVNEEARSSEIENPLKKGEEITDEAAKCSEVIQHDQIHEAKLKNEGAHSTATVKSILDEEAAVNDAEERNSPERYLIENKKEKKKTKKKKPFWVPFMCCSSVHRDL